MTHETMADSYDSYDTDNKNATFSQKRRNEFFHNKNKNI